MRVPPLDMQCLVVRLHGPIHQLHTSVQTTYLLLLYCPVGWTLHHHPLIVSNLVKSAIRVTWLAGHTDRLVDILPQSYPVKEEHQDIQSLLEPGC